MKRLQSILKGKSGASLIAVIIAIMFIASLGTIITQITITNIRMKEIEASGKKNFYSAETIVDELKTALNDKKASMAMKEAYTETLSDYRNIMVTGSNIQNNFSRRYITKLKALFADPAQAVFSQSRTVDGESIIYYETGKSKFDTIQGLLTTEHQGNLIPKKDISGDALPIDFEVDYDNGVFVLKDLHLLYDDNGYETNVYTDVVFHTPVLNFRGTNMVKDFMKYSLISDNAVEVVANSSNLVVDGNIYAGTGGIVCNSMQAVSETLAPQFIGNTIVTRGDIKAEKNAKWYMGTDTTKVWAANIVANESSKTVLKGTQYVEDDLALNGKDSEVYVEGFYYGYNFQQEYASLNSTLSKDASFSSAMMINGKNSKLDLSQAKYIMLAGRSYIQRSGSEPNDILMGESISVRSNQMAYFVPSAFVTEETLPNGTKVYMILGDSQEKLAKYMGFTDAYGNVDTSPIMSNVNTVSNVTPYKYAENTVEYTVYYLNFASEQSANNFFAAYESGARHNQVNEYAERYVADDALILGADTLYTLKGNLLYRDGASVDKKLMEKKITIGLDNWKSGGAYWNYVKRLAQSYKTLQTHLEQYSISAPAKVRIYTDESAANPVVNKAASPLVYNLMNVSDASNTEVSAMVEKLKSLHDGSDACSLSEVEYFDNSDRTRTIWMKNGDLDFNATEASGGIIICKGNVSVNGDFSGMILATGKITLNGNSTITANEILVSQMFSEDMMSSKPIFSDCFYNFNEFTESVIGQVKIDDFLTYDNWTKSKEN